MNARSSSLPTAAWNRRQFLRVGGLTVTTGALLVACGDQGGDTGVPRVGTVPPTTARPKPPVTDATLLRTATSLEYNAMYVYDAVAALGVLDADQAAIAARFRSDHDEHAAATAALSVDLGAESFLCPNPRLQSVYIEPALRLILGSKGAADALGIDEGDVEIEPSDTPVEDILVLADALESLAAATYQAIVVMLNDVSLRAEAIRIGAQEAQHAGLLGALINPTALIAVDGVAVPEATSPSTTVAPAVGLPTTVASPDVTEAPAPTAAALPIYAVPSTFGLLAPIQIQLGKPNEAAIRTTLILETPSLNSLAYEYMTCEG